MLAKGNPMGRVMMTILIFEVITIGLAIPVMIMVSEVPGATAGIAGGGAALLAILAAALLRRPAIGYPLGWLAQLAALGLGVLTVGMLAMGAMFAVLWVVCFVLGRRLDAGQRAQTP
ncbi:DUF4233 domain-containing protein [Enemella evansiae]|nr:DUF4233 domain-containing protein [Enemella evansiae]PFG66480.1 uncharacterized protein DUF4233 [Propionibacteriaceae bacterium ES.041]TDO87924.1 uncharacterized protein DUF4233 [Enemella evansiae]